MKQDTERVIDLPRRVPESVKDVVKKELKRMIEIDVIEKVGQPTDWVNSVVYVTKPTTWSINVMYVNITRLHNRMKN